MANWILKDLRADLYFANPALGSTSLKVLSDPEISLHEAKYLIEKNEHKKAYDIGTLAHALILEGSIDHVISEVPFANYRTKEAQLMRDAAYKVGKIPVNETERDELLGPVVAMQEAVMSHPLTDRLFVDHEPEVSLFWQRDGVNLKARIDALHRGPRVAVDLKTCYSARPNDVVKQISNLGYYIQAAHYLDGLKTIFGHDFEWIFVFVQNTEPYTVSVHRLQSAALEDGRLRVDHALDRWHRGVAEGWPGYAEIFEQGLTPWEAMKNEALLDEMITV